MFSVIRDCRVARPRALAWPCTVTWGSKHGHATARDRATTSVFGQMWVKTRLETRGYRTTAPCGTNNMTHRFLRMNSAGGRHARRPYEPILISLDLPSPRR